MKGKNLSLEQETQKSLRSFSFEDAFLSGENYKVLFIISIIIELCKLTPFIAILLEGKLLSVVDIVFLLLYFTSMYIWYGLFLFTPVFFVLRVIITHKLKKKIQKLEEALFIGENISRLRDALSQECEEKK